MPSYQALNSSSFGHAALLLPTESEDNNTLDIPIPYSAIYPLGEEDVRKRRKGSFIEKLRGGLGNRKEGFKVVKMTREEYLMYW